MMSASTCAGLSDTRIFQSQVRCELYRSPRRAPTSCADSARPVGSRVPLEVRCFVREESSSSTTSSGAVDQPSQSSSTLCSESHVMTTHLHSSWRKPHLPCDPFELSASMRRLRSREKARRQVTRITRQPPARAGSR
eukprot:tig00000431_g672.t1